MEYTGNYNNWNQEKTNTTKHSQMTKERENTLSVKFIVRILYKQPGVVTVPLMLRIIAAIALIQLI